MVNPDQTMRRYYLAMGIIVLTVVVIVGAIFVTDAPKRADRITSDQLQNASTAVNEYVTKNKKLPRSSSAFEDKTFSKITYKQLDYDTLMLCAQYKTKQSSSSSLNNEITSVKLKRLTKQEQAKATNTNFVSIGSYLYSPPHNVGRNCYLIVNDALLNQSSNVDIIDGFNEGFDAETL